MKVIHLAIGALAAIPMLHAQLPRLEKNGHVTQLIVDGSRL